MGACYPYIEVSVYEARSTIQQNLFASVATLRFCFVLFCFLFCFALFCFVFTYPTTTVQSRNPEDYCSKVFNKTLLFSFGEF